MRSTLPITRFTPGPPYSTRPSNFPKVNIPSDKNKNRETPSFTVSSSGLLIPDSTPGEDYLDRDSVKVVHCPWDQSSQGKNNGQTMVVQKRPQSYEKYIENTHDERDLISNGKKKVPILDIVIKDHAPRGAVSEGRSNAARSNYPSEDIESLMRLDAIAVKDDTITQSRRWLLNQRQGDETHRVAEWDPVPIAPPVPEFTSSLHIDTDKSGSNNSLSTHDNPYDTDGEDYLRSLEYGKTQIAENSSKKKAIFPYPPRTNSRRPLYQTDIPKLTMPQDFLQTGREPLPGPNTYPVFPTQPVSSPYKFNMQRFNTEPKAVVSPVHQLSPRANSEPNIGSKFMGIPQVSFGPIPAPITSSSSRSSSTVSSTSHMLQTKSQVGMSESLLQMNIPLFLQNNIGTNAAWT